jgi:hypothetical protein
MKNEAVSNDVPTVGLECRSNGMHAWVKIEAGVERIGDAYYYKRSRCANDCGGFKTRRYTYDGERCTWEESSKDKITYGEGYLLKGAAADKDMLKDMLKGAVVQSVIRECDPNRKLGAKPKSAAKKAAPEKVATPATKRTVPAKGATKRAAPVKAAAPAKRAKPAKAAQPLKRASERTAAKRTTTTARKSTGSRLKAS